MKALAVLLFASATIVTHVSATPADEQFEKLALAEIDTLYLMASPQYSFLSSSGVKEMATFGGDVTDLVPTPVAARLKYALDRRHRSE